MLDVQIDDKITRKKSYNIYNIYIFQKVAMRLGILCKISYLTYYIYVYGAILQKLA